MRTKKAISKLLLEYFASERRVIVSKWRIEVVYQNLAIKYDFVLPDASNQASLLRSLISNGIISSIDGVSSVYKISVPFASILPLPAEGILQEANPIGFFGFESAFVYHGLTDKIPSNMYFYLAGKESGRLPHGTKPDDWSDFSLPGNRRPRKIKNRAVIYTNSKPEWDFGVSVGYVEGVPIFVTDLEKTIVDSFRRPEKCGGISSLVEAWIRAIDLVNLETIVEYVNRIGQSLLKQRVGYIFEARGKSHRVFDHWAETSIRGSSARLIASGEFSSQYSERWNLSLNIPESMLNRLSEKEPKS